MVPITVKGVPILASVSNMSIYTIVSTAFVEAFGLKKTNLTSKSFQTEGRLGSGMAGTVLKELSFMLGDIPVTLHTALEMPALDGDRIGVQLGLDFFMRAAWCQIVVECGNKGTFLCTDGGGPMGGILLSKEKEEQFRYHAHGGKSYVAPVLHLDPHTDGYLPGVKLHAAQKFHVCNWCCRFFPDMGFCAACKQAGIDVRYCDSSCQAAAWPVHKKKCRKNK
jgi:hypothetical protein